MHCDEFKRGRGRSFHTKYISTRKQMYRRFGLRRDYTFSTDRQSLESRESFSVSEKFDQSFMQRECLSLYVFMASAV
jgi:hypothetical protein